SMSLSSSMPPLIDSLPIANKPENTFVTEFIYKRNLFETGEKVQLKKDIVSVIENQISSALESKSNPVEKETKKPEFKPIDKEEMDQLRAKFINEAVQEIDTKLRTPLKQVEYKCGNFPLLPDRI